VSADLNLPSVERDINGTGYRATIMHLGEWYALQELALDVFGESLEQLFGAFPTDGEGRIDIGALQTEQLASALHALLRGLGSRRLSALVDTMAQAVDVRASDGRWRRLDASIINGHFRRHMRDLVPVLALHLEVQFKDFFGGALTALPALMQTSGLDASEPQSTDNGNPEASQFRQG